MGRTGFLDLLTWSFFTLDTLVAKVIIHLLFGTTVTFRVGVPRMWARDRGSRVPRWTGDKALVCHPVNPLVHTVKESGGGEMMHLLV